MDEKKTIWVVKYCLTQGIFSVEAKINPENGIASDQERFTSRYHLRKKGVSDYYLTEQEAIDAAETMRKAKIASLKKQIAKLEKMDFTKKG